MIITYAIKSAIALSVLYACLMPLMGRETFHRLNRMLAITAMLTALAAPFVHIRHADGPTLMSRVVELPALTVLADAPNATPSALSMTDIATLIYLSVAALMLIVMATQTTMLMLRLHRARHLSDGKGNTIVLTDSCKSPFCLFRYIVMSPYDYEHNSRYILTHEQMHIRMWHVADLILIAIVTTVQWFNPFAWLLARDLRATHEYEADEAVIHQGIDATKYQKFLVLKAVGNSMQPFANALTRGSLKKRIIMMNQKKSSRWLMLKALLIIPVAALTVDALATESAADGLIESATKAATVQETTTVQETEATPSAALSAQAKKPQAKKKTVKNEPDANGVYSNSDVLPQFPGGVQALLAYINSTVKYPKEAITDGKQGRSLVSFVIMKEGTIDNVAIAKSAGSDILDQEAIRVVKSMPKWEPGTIKGKPVNVKFNVPIQFRLKK